MSAFRSVAAAALLVALAAGPDAALASMTITATPDVGAAAAPGDYTPPATTKVTPYVAGRTLTWTSFEQLAGDGTVGPADAVSLAGVGAGAMGIIETGTDLAAGKAASWSSADGGASWTEHIVPSGAAGFGGLAAKGGVFVTHERAFWTSIDGAFWAPAATGPHALQWATLVAGPQGFVAFVRNGSSTITRVWLSRTGAYDSWVAAPVQGVVSQFCPLSVAATSSRIIAVGFDCGHPSRARVLVSKTGHTWARGTVPSGLRTAGMDVGAPSISFVSRRYLLTGANATRTATWVWSTLDGVTWHHVSSMARVSPWGADGIVRVVRLDPGLARHRPPGHGRRRCATRRLAIVGPRPLVTSLARHDELRRHRSGSRPGHGGGQQAHRRRLTMEHDRPVRRDVDRDRHALTLTPNRRGRRAARIIPTATYRLPAGARAHGVRGHRAARVWHARVRDGDLTRARIWLCGRYRQLLDADGRGLEFGRAGLRVRGVDRQQVRRDVVLEVQRHERETRSQ